MLDAIGYSTVPEDIKVAEKRLGQIFEWFLTIPWWAVLGVALFATMWLMWVSWPRASGHSPDASALGHSPRNDARLSEHAIQNVKYFCHTHLFPALHHLLDTLIWVGEPPNPGGHLEGAPRLLINISEELLYPLVEHHQGVINTELLRRTDARRMLDSINVLFAIFRDLSFRITVLQESLGESYSLEDCKASTDRVNLATHELLNRTPELKEIGIDNYRETNRYWART